MFPVVVLSEGVELPTSGNYYIITADGVFLHKETKLITATVKVGGVPFLEPLQAEAELRLPKIPAEIMVRTVRFFRSVHHKLDTEAIVLLHYAPETGEYRLSCPEQTVSSARLHYEDIESFPGYLLVGSIHSHNRFPAGHSGVDRHDESDFDGLHITIGQLDLPHFNISCSVAVNNNRFLVAPEKFIDGIEVADWKPKPTVRQVHKKVEVVNQPPQAESFWGFLGLVTGFGMSCDDEWETELVEDPDQYYKMVLPDGRPNRTVGFPRNWLKRVTSEKQVVTAIPPYVGPTPYQPLVVVEEGGAAELTPVELMSGGCP